MTTVRHLSMLVLLALAPVSAVGAASDENRDLDLLPPAADTPGSAESAPGRDEPTSRKLRVEGVLTSAQARQSLLVPFPDPQPAGSEARLLLDLRREWTIAPATSFNLSGRLNVRAADHLPFPDHDNILAEWREAYVGFQPVEQTYLDIGRINHKSGSAQGFNPTDYFKTRASVEPLSPDPLALREDRLGTLMMRLQRVWTGASAIVAWAPKVSSPTPIYSRIDLPSVDPMFDRTNSADRFLTAVSTTDVMGVSAELLLYKEGPRTEVGTNLTHSFGANTVAYLEWSGGRRASLIHDALEFGRATGTLPASAPAVLPDEAERTFRSQLAIGGSYALAVSRITLNAEFHYSEPSFSRSDWNAWFDAGRAAAGRGPVAAELWYLRNYALDQSEPIGRRSIFLRADWIDALVPKLELSGFLNTDLSDGSGRLQLAADYALSDHWTFGGIAFIQYGGRHSDFGSLPQSGAILVKLARYL